MFCNTPEDAKKAELKMCYDQRKGEQKTNVPSENCGVHLCLTKSRNCFTAWHKRWKSSGFTAFFYLCEDGFVQRIINLFLHYSWVIYVQTVYSEFSLLYTVFVICMFFTVVFIKSQLKWSSFTFLYVNSILFFLYNLYFYERAFHYVQFGMLQCLLE